MTKSKTPPIHRPSTVGEFRRINDELNSRRYVAIDVFKAGGVRSVPLGSKDPSESGAKDMVKSFGSGSWCRGPLSTIAFEIDDRSSNSIETVSGPDGNPLGLGYVKWGSGDCIPSTIPVWAAALPYTAAPLRYIADLTAGLGPRLMYRFEDGTMCEYRDAGERLRQKIEELQEAESRSHDDPLAQPIEALNPHEDTSPALSSAREALAEWEDTWNGHEATDPDGTKTHIPGAREFLEDNNLNLLMSQCMQDDVMLDIYFPTVGFNRGRRGQWDPRIVRVDMLPAHSCRLERMNEFRHINHVYFSDSLRTRGAGVTAVSTDKESQKFVMYPAAMPQHTLSDLQYIVDSNQRTSIKNRPMWVVCPTFYPSGQKPYYPQPAWWSVFTSKAFDFSSTILYDKAKQRENNTTWGRIIYISLDYLEQVFADEGYRGNKDKQQEFIEGLEADMEDFLQHRENNGKFMRQWMWDGQDGHVHKNVEIVDVAEAVKDAVTAGKEELELSTAPIFLALQVDPRLVGVPMVQASNGGTALREMHLLKQQQLNVKQQLFLHFLGIVPAFNKWDRHCEWVIMQQTLTTLDNSKTGTVETIAGGKA